MNNIPERIIKLRLGSLCRVLSDEEAAEFQQWSDSHHNLKKDLDDLSGLFGDYMLAENYNNIDVGNAEPVPDFILCRSQMKQSFSTDIRYMVNHGIPGFGIPFQ